MRHGVIFSVAITLVIFGVYFQVSNHGFLDFDDTTYVVDNPAVNSGITAQGVAEAFSFSKAHYWHPASTISHAMDVSLFGMKPGIHHLVNVLFHVYVVLLCFWALFLATGKFGPSAFAAALLALHPMNVESVAWIAERKTLLSTCFGLLAMLFYTAYVKKPKTILYAGVVAAFAIALLAKPSIAPLALVLLLMDYWPFYRTGERGADGSPGFSWPAVSRLIVEKLPLLVIAAIVILVVNSSMGYFQNLPGTEKFSLRLSNALISYPRYLLKLLWPDNLAVFYPYPKSVPAWQAAAALGFLTAITALVFRFARKNPYLVVGWLWFVGGLVPVLGLVQGGLWPAWADRFVYFPAIGLFVAVSFWADDRATRMGMDRSVLMPACIVIALCLAVVTFAQTGFWKNDFTLFSRAAAVTANNNVALTSLGSHYAEKGDFAKAISYYESSIKANPSDAFAYRNMADIFFKRKDYAKAEGLYKKSLKINPSDYRTYKKYARLLSETKRTEEAIANMNIALKINPNDFEAENNLGSVYLSTDDAASAALHFQKSLDIKPGNKIGLMYLERAKALVKMGAQMAAVKKAIAEKGENPELLNVLGSLYINVGKPSLALPPLSRAVSQNPGNAGFWSNYGLALLQTGDFTKAKDALDRALVLDPKKFQIIYNMACLASRSGDIEAAAGWIQKAVDLGFAEWRLLAVDSDLENARKSPAVQKLIMDHSTDKASFAPPMPPDAGAPVS